MQDTLVERMRLEKMEIRCECGVDVNKTPRNYHRKLERSTPELQIFRYFCKNCKETFGFYAKGIIPDCPPMFSRHSHEGGADTTHPHSKIREMKDMVYKRVLEYREELRKYRISSEPMVNYLNIGRWKDGWDDDWNDVINSGGSIPIFSGHATMDDVLDVIDPENDFYFHRGQDITPFCEWRNGSYYFSGSSYPKKGVFDDVFIGRICSGNFTTAEIEEMDYEAWFGGSIRERTPLQEWAVEEIYKYIFWSRNIETDLVLYDGEDKGRAIGRPARIFQLGMGGESVDIVSTLDCIGSWAMDHCRRIDYGPGETYGLRVFLEELWEGRNEELADIRGELEKILWLAPDYSDAPPDSFDYKHG